MCYGSGQRRVAAQHHTAGCPVKPLWRRSGDAGTIVGVLAAVWCYLQLECTAVSAGEHGGSAGWRDSARREARVSATRGGAGVEGEHCGGAGWRDTARLEARVSATQDGASEAGEADGNFPITDTVAVLTEGLCWPYPFDAEVMTIDRHGCTCAVDTAGRSGLWSEADGTCKPLAQHIGQSSRLEAIAAANEPGLLAEGSDLFLRLWRRSGGIGILVEESAADRQVPQVHPVGYAGEQPALCSVSGGHQQLERNDKSARAHFALGAGGRRYSLARGCLLCGERSGGSGSSLR